jgi:hypothetical protein
MTATDTPTGINRFFTDATFDFEFEFRDALGATAYGVGDPGMWLATAHEIVDQCSWFNAWTARADQLSGLGEAAAAQGDRHGASRAYLSPSAAYSKAMGAIDGLPADEGNAVLLPTFRKLPRAAGTP